MQKFLCACVAVLCLMCCLPHVAFAASNVEWVRVVDDNVCLFATAESSKVLFQLAKSYYLRVLEEESELYLVSVMENQADFPQIVGYVWKSEVEVCDETPVLPYYPTEKITVEADSAQLKLTPTPNSSTVITVTNSQKMSYYGQVTSYSQIWYYVCFHGKFGYVSAENVTKPVIAMHPTPIEQEVVVPPQPNETDDKPNETDDAVTQQPTVTSGSEIFLIIFVAVLALGICLALFLPGNFKKKDVFDKDI